MSPTRAARSASRRRCARRRAAAATSPTCAPNTPRSPPRTRASTMTAIGFWPANSVGDDIVLFADETRKKPMAVLHGLRQQAPKREGRANLSLGDFVAPAETGLEDYIGGFIVTAGLGGDDLAERFKQ